MVVRPIAPFYKFGLMRTQNPIYEFERKYRKSNSKGNIEIEDEKKKIRDSIERKLILSDFSVFERHLVAKFLETLYNNVAKIYIIFQ